MSFKVNYHIKRYQDGVKYYSVLMFLRDKPSFRFRFYVVKARGNLLFLIDLGNGFPFKSF